MVSRIAVLLALACVQFAATLPSQVVPWLRPVSRLALPEERVVAAALAPDGATLATVGDDRTVRVFAVEPWRELRHFRVPDLVVIDDAQVTADGAILVLKLAAGEDPSQIAVRLADGSHAEAAWEPRADDPAPPGLLDVFPEAKSIRSCRDGSATFADQFGQALWRDGEARALGIRTVDAWLTGDGNHVVLQSTGAVQVWPVAGGETWLVPESGHGAVATFGRSAFVAVDSHSLVLADAAARSVTRRVELAKFGVKLHQPHLVAVHPDGKRMVVADWAFHTGAGAWLLDLDATTSTRLPVAPVAAIWAPEGLLLLEGIYGPCAVAVRRWLWLADTAEPNAPLVEWTEPPTVLQPDESVVQIPGQRQVLLAHFPADGSMVQALGRFDASDGKVLSNAPLGSSLLIATSVVAGHAVVVRSEYPGRVLELRRLDDLTVASLPAPVDLRDARQLRGATHAPRILLRSPDALAIFDVVPPAAAK